MAGEIARTDTELKYKTQKGRDPRVGKAIIK